MFVSADLLNIITLYALFNFSQTIKSGLVFGTLVAVFMDKFHQNSKPLIFMMYSDSLLSINFDFGKFFLMMAFSTYLVNASCLNGS